MRIEIYINGDKYLYHADSFSESFLNIINKTLLREEYFEFHKTKAEEIKLLSEVCQKDNLVFIIDKHLTFDVGFALNLKIFDIVYCPCMLPLTNIGDVIRELMIDNYQLILTSRNWLETDYLKLYFEVVDCGEADLYVINTLRLIT